MNFCRIGVFASKTRSGCRALLPLLLCGCIVIASGFGSPAAQAQTKGKKHTLKAAEPEMSAAYNVPPLVDALIEPVSAPPKTPPVILLYNPARRSELSIFTGPALRFVQSARSHRPKFDGLSAREKIHFLERYVFAICNSRLVNGMDLVFKLETGSENFCGYSPGMLNCYADEECDEAKRTETAQYVQGTLEKYDRFVDWAERRRWQYRGDALKVGFYTRNTLTKSGMICATLKLVNDNDEAVLVRLKSSLRTVDGRLQTVFSKPYYVGPRASLPNLSDEDLFSKDTELRMRQLTADAQAVAKRMSVVDIQAYTGTHERWNCFPSPGPDAQQPRFQQLHIEFPG
ncbi:MAG: hypothetical protein KBD60_09645 [Sterolibacterium sp.]|jgi:hypothetical protein|nr:hypothetical protein [Sterolibacterium sp.]